MFRLTTIMLTMGASISLGNLLLKQLDSSAQQKMDRADKSDFRVTELVNASKPEIAQRAKDITKAKFEVMSDTIKVAANRSTKPSEIKQLGLGSVGFAGKTPPLQLVIMRGEFDIGNLPGGNDKEIVNYLGYVIDLKTGLPTYIVGSPNESNFKKALGDPSLPDRQSVSKSDTGFESTKEAAPGNIKPHPYPAEGEQLPYGAEIP